MAISFPAGALTGNTTADEIAEYGELLTFMKARVKVVTSAAANVVTASGTTDRLTADFLSVNVPDGGIPLSFRMRRVSTAGSFWPPLLVQQLGATSGNTHSFSGFMTPMGASGSPNTTVCDAGVYKLDCTYIPKDTGTANRAVAAQLISGSTELVYLLNRNLYAIYKEYEVKQPALAVAARTNVSVTVDKDFVMTGMWIKQLNANSWWPCNVAVYSRPSTTEILLTMSNPFSATAVVANNVCAHITGFVLRKA